MLRDVGADVRTVDARLMMSMQTIWSRGRMILAQNASGNDLISGPIRIFHLSACARTAAGNGWIDFWNSATQSGEKIRIACAPGSSSVFDLGPVGIIYDALSLTLANGNIHAQVIYLPEP